MIGALKAAAVLALAGSSLAAPAAVVARSSAPSSRNELVISPKVMIISMVRPACPARRLRDPGVGPS